MKKQLQYFILVLINFKNNSLNIGINDTICIKEFNSKFKQKIMCFKNNNEIQKFKSEINQKILEVGQNKVCQFENQYEMTCEIQNSHIKYQYSMNHEQNILNQTNQFTNIIIKELQTCVWNVFIIKCFDLPIIISSIPQDLSVNVWQNILNIVGSDENVCVVVKHPGHYIIKSILCFGSSDSGINDVPLAQTNIDHNLDIIISMGTDTVCAIIDNSYNSSRCWGKCSGNICNIPKNLLLSKVIKISIGKTHACLINQFKYKNSSLDLLGILSCWGNNEYGQSSIPSTYKHQIIEVTTSEKLTCAMRQNGSVECWGQKNETFPSLVQKLKSISTGGRHTCGIQRGWQECWGNNEFGQNVLGDENRHELVSSISAGWDQTCYQGKNDLVRCVGFNQYGQIDVPEELNDNLESAELKNIQSGLSHSCVTQFSNSRRGTLECWGGQNEHSELDMPKVDEQEESILNAAVGNDFTCQVSVRTSQADTQFIHCFGNNDFGQSVQFSINQTILRELEAGGAHACYVSSWLVSDKIHCWGSDSNGQGQVPSGLLHSSSLALGDGHSCLVETQSGDVVCWGSWAFRRAHLQPLMLDTSQEQFCVVGEQETGLCWGDNEWGQCDVPEEGQISG